MHEYQEVRVNIEHALHCAIYYSHVSSAQGSSDAASSSAAAEKNASQIHCSGLYPELPTQPLGGLAAWRATGKRVDRCIGVVDTRPTTGCSRCIPMYTKNAFISPWFLPFEIRHSCPLLSSAIIAKDNSIMATKLQHSRFISIH